MGETSYDRRLKSKIKTAVLQFMLGAPCQCTIGHFPVALILRFKLKQSEKPLRLANKAHLHHKGVALNLVLKVRATNSEMAYSFDGNELMAGFC